MRAEQTPKSETTRPFQADWFSRTSLPVYLSRISAGFPSPADDYVESKLDLNEHLIRHPAATFYLWVKGDSMINAGIQSGDLLIVDKSLKATNRKIIVAILNGEFTVKRFVIRDRKTYLSPENPEYREIEINADMDFQVWGVVTNVIHEVK
jgi:DNA polymerase V